MSITLRSQTKLHVYCATYYSCDTTILFYLFLKSETEKPIVAQVLLILKKLNMMGC